METWLCNTCGTRIDASVRTCPTCGALNPHNEEIIAEVVQQVVQENKAARKFSAGFSVVSLIVGIALFIIHIVLLVSGGPFFLTWQLFVGAVAGGMAAVFSIIGLTKNEGVGKLVLISCAVSLWMLFMYAFISF